MALHMMGRKLGMTQVFDESGQVTPVTVIQVGPCTVVRKKTEGRDGYNALVLGYQDEKEQRLRRSELGQYRKAGVSPKRMMRESPVAADELDRFEAGQEITVELFEKGGFVDVTGRSKGRGFSGVMKRHNMSGAKSSHGTHEYFRHGGSIGSSATPSRVFKGKRMAGRYGGTRVTVQNLQVTDVRPDKGILLVKGAVPGPNKGLVSVSRAVKKPAVS
ncbi:MAG: 50S ribosomal protein L3 [Spirochaetota bacterium]